MTLADLKMKEEFTRGQTVIEFNRKHKDKLDSLIKEYNNFSKDFPPRVEDELQNLHQELKMNYKILIFKPLKQK
ncbi:MAG: hypothetical protein ACTSP7_09450 [Candidatus Heimdallarchaeota archaeon]